MSDNSRSNHDLNLRLRERRWAKIKTILFSKYGLIALLIAAVGGAIAIRAVVMIGGNVTYIDGNAHYYESGADIPDLQNVNLAYSTAQEYYANREYGKAAENLVAAIDEQNALTGSMSIEVARIHTFLGLVYLNMGDYGSSLESVNNAIGILPKADGEYQAERGLLLYYQARVYYEMLDYKRAEESITEAEKIAFDSNVFDRAKEYFFSIYLVKGQITLYSGKPEEAISCFDRGLYIIATHDPDNVASKPDDESYSVEYQELTDNPTMLTFYYASKEVSEYLANRAYAYFLLLKLDKAERDTDLTLDMLSYGKESQRTAYPLAMMNKSLLAIYNKDFDAAIDYADKAVNYSVKWNGRDHPHTAKWRDRQGNVLFYAPNYECALECYATAYPVFLRMGWEDYISETEDKMRDVYENYLYKTDFDTWLSEQVD